MYTKSAVPNLETGFLPLISLEINNILTGEQISHMFCFRAEATEHDVFFQKKC
jgi:hypothetical protein